MILAEVVMDQRGAIFLDPANDAASRHAGTGLVVVGGEQGVDVAGGGRGGRRGEGRNGRGEMRMGKKIAGEIGEGENSMRNVSNINNLSSRSIDYENISVYISYK